MFQKPELIMRERDDAEQTRINAGPVADYIG